MFPCTRLSRPPVPPSWQLEGASKDQLKKLGLTDKKDYTFVNGTTTIKGVDDKKEFKELEKVILLSFPPSLLL